MNIAKPLTAAILGVWSSAALADEAHTGWYQASSGPKDSGEGGNYSQWYSVCTAEVQIPWVEIKKWNYSLQGDRSCGSWANCEVTEDTNARKCVRFRMQGHSEGGILAKNSGTGRSELIIRYYVYVDPNF